MWVTDALRGRVRKFILFVVIVALATLYLYFFSYEGGVKESSSDAPATTSATAIEATTTSVQSAVTPDTQKPAPKKVATTQAAPISPWKSVMTTLFWVGEPADSDNAYITNTESYWDEKWEAHYGGIDDPNCRYGYGPCGFAAKENPFYFALPYGEYDDNGNLKSAAKRVPWYGKDSQQLLKNRWIEVKHNGYICYAQWEDVGPNGEDDFSYVFGNTKPVNTFGEKAGLDSSPALWKCLHMSDNDVTSWAFVDASDVPSGPWKDIVTTSGTSWDN